MRKMKLVMVGNGMAGVRALEELLKLAPDMYDITTAIAYADVVNPLEKSFTINQI